MNVSERLAANCELVEVAGKNAPWICMVHGVSQNRRLFDPQVAAFSAEYRILLIDLPGHGASSDLPGPYGLEEFSQSIDAAIREADVNGAHFWGTHLGAGAGLLLASRQPTLFQSMVLEGPVFPGRPLPAVNELLTKIARVAKEEGIVNARDIWWNEGGWFDVMRARPDECRAGEQIAMINEFGGQPWLDSGLASRPIAPIERQLSELDIPILIVNGENDLKDFTDVASELASILPQSQQSVIHEAGGFPLWEFPDRVNDIVRDFLQSQ